MRISPAGGEGIRGRVADVSFYGAMTHVHVEVRGLDRPVVVTNQGPMRLAMGSEVTVTWPPGEGVVLLD
jgi:ABC-type Fe3+/spermidine/putrescine transport system ATPase subunit